MSEGCFCLKAGLSVTPLGDVFFVTLWSFWAVVPNSPWGVPYRNAMGLPYMAHYIRVTPRVQS